MLIKRRIFNRLSFSASILGAVPAAAQDRWPQRAVRIVVPYSPGSGTDSHSRRLAQDLAPRLGQPVVVENKTGAMGTIGMSEVARARPDGYTLLGIDSGVMILPHLVRSMPVEVGRDLIPVAAYIFSPMCLIVNAASPYRTLQDLVRAARTEPGKISYGSGGIGTSPQLLAENFASKVDATLLSVPFRGAGEAAQALMAGTIDMLIASPATALGNLGPGGRLRMLAVGSERRLPLLPDVPTFAEAGVADFVVNSWISLFAPAGTRAEVTERLAQEVVSIMNTPEMKAYAEGIAGVPRVAVGPDLAALLASDSNRWKATIDRIGLVPQ